MATKTITGSYPAGYYLKPTYDTLNVASTANVGDAGVTTTNLQSSTINNLGNVDGTANGITLSDGGAVRNGNSTNTTALVEGTNAIVTNNAAAKITNYGEIKSAGVLSGYPTTGTYYNYYASIKLNKGGTVTNRAAAEISNGISIAGAAGTVVNDGVIGAPGHWVRVGYEGMTPLLSFYYDRAVIMTNGGKVTNGSGTNTSADIRFGVDISGGTGGIVNNGHIGGVKLLAGGTVSNGSGSNSAAHIDGVQISGTGKVTNYGQISSVSISGKGAVTNYDAIYGVSLGHGGTVTNGTSSKTAVSIINAFGNGITIAGGAGTVANFGSVLSTVLPGYQIDAGVSLAAGGTLINGSADDKGALISGGIGVTLQGVGTITNFGTIEGTAGTAVSIGSSSATLVEEGSGVIFGAIKGAGGTLVLAGDDGNGALNSTITGFGSIEVQSGAQWALFGSTTTVTGSTITNAGSLLNNGTMTLLGQTVNSGAILNEAGGIVDFAADVSITTDPTTKAGQFFNFGLLEKTGGTGTSIIRTGNDALRDPGTIDVETGTLVLTGNIITVAGLIEGAGTIEFSTGATTLGTGSSITTAGLTIAGAGTHVTLAQALGYAGSFLQGANTKLTLAGELTLAGATALSHATIDGNAQFATGGATSLGSMTLGGTVEWLNSGTITETTQFTIDAGGHLNAFDNKKGAVFDIAGNAGIDGTTSAGFANAGLLEKTLGGLSAIGLAVANTGTIEAASGTLDLQKAVTGTGLLKIDAGKAIQADGAVSAGQTVDFNGGGDKLVLSDAAHFAGKLKDFGSTDRFDLRQFDPATTTLAFSENGTNTAGVLVATDGALQAKITLLGQYAASAFHKASDGVGGTLVTYSPSAANALAPPHG
jgi:hypothetical protein